MECETAQIIVPLRRYPMKMAAGPPLTSEVPLPSHNPIPIDEPSAIMVRWRVLKERWRSVSAP